MAKNIVSLFIDRSDADRAIMDLMESGFTREDISIITNESINTVSQTDIDELDDTVSDSAATGAATGGALGALLGLLTGIGAIALPPIGGIFIAGPLAAAFGISTAAAATLAGGAIGAAGGGFTGALVGMGLPSEEAVTYIETLQKNGVVLGVFTETDTEESVVKDIFARNSSDKIWVANK
jgi:uncharacterized membrane protein